jgi:hypothetical protein
VPAQVAEKPKRDGGWPVSYDEERVERAARGLRELEASGVGAVEILGVEAEVVFVRDYCGGDPDVAAAAFALVHSPSAYPPVRCHEMHRRAHSRSL